MEEVVKLVFEGKSLKRVSEATGLKIASVKAMWLDWGLRRGLGVHADTVDA